LGNEVYRVKDAIAHHGRSRISIIALSLYEITQYALCHTQTFVFFTGNTYLRLLIIADIKSSRQQLTSPVVSTALSKCETCKNQP